LHAAASRRRRTRSRASSPAARAFRSTGWIAPISPTSQRAHPERVIETDWGGSTTGVFAADIIVDAHDRQGLLRDISEIFTRERLNVVGVNTQSKQGKAHMSFTVEITNLQQLQKTLTLIHDVEGVVGVRRA
jgi:GTP pyrophosphokinase